MVRLLFRRILDFIEAYRESAFAWLFLFQGGIVYISKGYLQRGRHPWVSMVTTLDVWLIIVGKSFAFFGTFTDLNVVKIFVFRVNFLRGCFLVTKVQLFVLLMWIVRVRILFVLLRLSLSFFTIFISVDNFGYKSLNLGKWHDLWIEIQLILLENLLCDFFGIYRTRGNQWI